MFRYEVEAYYTLAESQQSFTETVIHIYFKVDPVFEFQPFDMKQFNSQNHKC